MDRKHRSILVLLLKLGMTSILLAACGGAAATDAPATEAPTDSPTEAAGGGEVVGSLTVLEWAYYEVPEMWADFGEAHPDVAVDFTFGSSDEDVFAKTRAGSGADIIHYYTPFMKFYVDEGLIQPIDTSRMEHWDEIPQQFQDLCTLDGEVYCVPWDWGYTSILYRTDMIPEGVDSWSALLDPKYEGHVSMWDSGYGAAQIGSYILGYEEDALSADQLAEIEQMWIDQRALNAFYWTAEPELVEAMTSGDVWIAYAWNGAYYSLLSAGVPVAYATPSEGRNSWVGQYSITADSDNYDAALAFLDGKLAEKTATNLLTMYAYGHVNPSAYAAVTDENLITALSLDDPTILDRTNFTLPITFEMFQDFVNMWAEVKAAP
jgi:spermidine/putrescine transport system substrate-binding protein